MRLTQFINQNLGRKIDFDGSYGCQCVDLYRYYLQEVLDIPQTAKVEGAKDIYWNYGNDEVARTRLKQIKECATADYSVGDILIWDATETNPYGHVAILVAIYNTKYFVVLEQNGFTQKGVELNLRSRENLLGGFWK